MKNPTMEDYESALDNKKSLKWFLSKIEVFNNVVPFQINTLTTFKTKIRQAYKLDNFTVIRQERTSAERTIRTLKQLQIDINNLREQVIESDHEKFDKLVQPSCERIKTALKSFSDFYDSLPLDRHSVRPWNSFRNEEEIVEKSNSDGNGHQSQVLLQMREDMWELENQLEIAKTTEKIEKDVQTVNEIFRDLSNIIHVDAEKVERIESNVETSHTQVVAAEKQLAQVVAKMKGGMYPLIGAVAGSIVAGPIGFVAGLKVGTAVALSGGAIGFSGGKILKMKEQRAQQKVLKELEKKSAVSVDEKSN